MEAFTTRSLRDRSILLRSKRVLGGDFEKEDQEKCGNVCENPNRNGIEIEEAKEIELMGESLETEAEMAIAEQLDVTEIVTGNGER